MADELQEKRRLAISSMLDEGGERKEARTDLFDNVHAPGLVTAGLDEIESAKKKHEEGRAWLDANPQWKDHPHWRQVFSQQKKKKLEV